MGEVSPEQDVKAFNWYRKAAEQGNVKAQYNLGQMYANGEGVPEDYVEAYATFERLAKNHAENRLSKKEIVKAQALSGEYWEKYVVPFQKE